MGNREKYDSRNPIQRALIAQFLRQAAALVAPLRTRRVLDVGCGEGFVAAALRPVLPRDAEIVGVDLRSTALRDAQRRSGVLPVRGSALSLPFGAACFDLVVATELLEHLATPEAALAELDRVAHEWLLVSVPWEPWFRGLNALRGRNLRRLGSDPDHRQHFSRSGFLRWLGRRHRVVAAPLRTFPWTLALARRRG